MEYTESNVCYVLDTKDTNIGTRGYFTDSLRCLKEMVVNEEQKYFGTLTAIKSEDSSERFVKDDAVAWTLFYPVDNSKDIPLTMNKVTNLCKDKSTENTYTLLASLAGKVVAATNRYTKWDLDHEHLAINKSEFTSAVVDLVCLCGAIAFRENIDLDKALAVRLYNCEQEDKVEED